MKNLCIAFVLLIAIVVPIFANKLIRVDVTDDFGDPTGEYYVTFDKDLDGTFKNSSKSGSIKWNAIFKNEKLLFVIKEDGIDKDVSTSSMYGEYYCDTNCSYELTFKNLSGETKSGYFRLVKSDNYKYNVLRWYSSWDIWSFTDLVMYLTKNDNLKMIMKSKYGTYQLGEVSFAGLNDLEFDKTPNDEALKLMAEGKYEEANKILADYRNNNPVAYISFNSALLQEECSRLCGQYYVGGIGPAGGFIFYDCDADNDSGNADGLVSSECGWRYLEAAPSNLSSKYIFGFYSSDGETKIEVGTETGIGTGKSNTEALVSAMGEKTYEKEYAKEAVETEYAAKACDLYSLYVDDVMYDDWFLPSCDELNLMYINLKRFELGDFESTYGDYYWSSSEATNWHAYMQNFGSGISARGALRGGSYCVRPIRAF